MRRATNRGGIQLCVKTLQMTMRTTEAVKCRRLAGPKSLLERPFHARDSCDEKKKLKKLTKKKQKLTGSSPRTHEVSALEASTSRNCRHVRQTPDLSRTAHVAIGSSVAKSKDPSRVKHRRVFARNAAELLTLSRTGRAQRAARMRCATQSTPTEKQDNNEFCLIKAGRQAPKAGRQAPKAGRQAPKPGRRPRPAAARGRQAGRGKQV